MTPARTARPRHAGDRSVPDVRDRQAHGTHGFTPFKTGTRVLWRCPKIGRSVQGEMRRCSFACRKDRIAKRLNHICRFDIPQGNDSGFKDIAEQCARLKTVEGIAERVHLSLAVFAAKQNISTSKIVNSTTLAFVKDLVRLGAELVLSGTGLDIGEFLTSLSYRRISEQILMEGMRQKGLDLFAAGQVRYVCLAMDAGSVLKTKSVYSVLTNPWESALPVICEIFNNDNYNAIQYELFVDAQLQRLFGTNVICCGVISDNLAAQVSGIRECLSNASDKRKQIISHIPCFAHMINLVFVNVMTRLQSLKTLTQEICSVGVTLRKPIMAGLIGTLCPVICRTRWLYIADVLAWILKRRRSLNSMFLKARKTRNVQLRRLVEEELPYQIPEEYIQLFQVLLPLKLFCLRVERTDARLCDIPPLVRGVVDMYRSIDWKSLSERIREVGKCLLASFMSRVSCNARDESVAAYLLSPVGRMEIRKSFAGLRTRGSESKLDYTVPKLNDDIPPLLNVDDEVVLTWNDESMDVDTKDEEEEQGSDISDEETPDIEELGLNQVVETGEDASNDIDDGPSEESLLAPGQVDEVSAYEESVSISLPKCIDDFLQMSIEELLQIDLYENMYATGRCVLLSKGVGGPYEMLELTGERIEERFDAYLFSDPVELPFGSIIGRNPNLFWRSVPLFASDWKAFSSLALTLISLSCSEADVERLISRQRDVQGMRTTNVHISTIEARMRIQMAGFAQLEERQRRDG